MSDEPLVVRRWPIADPPIGCLCPRGGPSKVGNLRSERPVQACHACRRFIEAFGGLVSITDDGTTIPAFWNPVTVPDFYSAAVKALRGAVRRARVIGVFLSSEDELGTARSDAWTHFTARQPAVFKHPLLTAFQAAAAVRENRVTALTALAEFKPGVLDGALRLMQAESLYRSERFIAPVKWLRDVHNRPEGRPGDNVPWRAVGSAAAGFCDPSASVIASLLENVASCDFTFDAIKARCDSKTVPSVSQRPHAAPTTGNFAAAEAVVAEAGIAPSLEHCYARLDEIADIIWQPKGASKVDPAVGGVFGHLQAKSGTPITHWSTFRL